MYIYVCVSVCRACVQARLGDAAYAEEEVTALAAFLGVSVPASMSFPLSPTFGDTSLLSTAQAPRMFTQPSLNYEYPSLPIVWRHGAATRPGSHARAVPVLVL